MKAEAGWEGERTFPSAIGRSLEDLRSSKSRRERRPPSGLDTALLSFSPRILRVTLLRGGFALRAAPFRSEAKFLTF